MNILEALKKRYPADVEKYEHIDLSNMAITSIEGLKFLSGFKTVNLSHNLIEHFRYNEGECFIETLILGNNQLVTITGLHHISGLSDLDLSYNRLTLIPNLKFLHSLKYLDADYNRLSEEGFVPAPYLEEICLNGNHFTSMECFSDLEHLTCLELSHNQITDFSTLRGPIERLKIGGNRISGILELTASTLKSIYIENNAISELRIPNSNLLKELSLASNPISGTDFIEHQHNLERLDLSFTDCSHDALGRLSQQLEWLNIGFTRFDWSVITGFLEKQKMIKSVNISGFRMASLKNIPKMETLDSLIMRSCALSSLESSWVAPRLQRLDVTQNNITSLSGVNVFAPDLVTLDILENPLTEISSINSLHKLGQMALKIDDVKDLLPLSDHDNYLKILLDRQ